MQLEPTSDPQRRIQTITGSTVFNHTHLGQRVQRLLASNAAAQIIAPYGTFSQGGCLVLARALQQLAPDQITLLVTVRDNGVTDHVIAQWSGLYLDGDGAGTAVDITEKMRICEFVTVARIAPLNAVTLHPDIESDPRTVTVLSAWLAQRLRLEPKCLSPAAIVPVSKTQ